MKTECERCRRALPPLSAEAVICSFECTFCCSCARELKEICPNCGGELLRRPARAAELLERYPPAA